jgi:hypothetical protein
MIDVGQVYPARFDVADASGAPVNPATVALAITKPDQTLVNPAPVITNPPAVLGTFTYDYVIADEGLHVFAWSSSAPVAAKTDYVHARRFRSAVSLAESRDYLNQQDTRRDELIRSMMMAATEEAEKIVGTLVPKVVTGEWVNGQYKDVIQVAEGPLMSATSVTSIASVWPGGPSWATADLIINPEAGTLRARDMLGFWWGPWTISSYTGGRVVIAEPIRLGILEILWDLWTPERGATADETYPSPTEAEAFTWSVPAGYHPPPRAMALLEPYERPGFG